MLHPIPSKNDNCLWYARWTVVAFYGFIGLMTGICRDIILNQSKISPQQMVMGGIIGLFGGFLFGFLLFETTRFIIISIQKSKKYNK